MEGTFLLLSNLSWSDCSLFLFVFLTDLSEQLFKFTGVWHLVLYTGDVLSSWMNCTSLCARQIYCINIDDARWCGWTSRHVESILQCYFSSCAVSLHFRTSRKILVWARIWEKKICFTHTHTAKSVLLQQLSLVAVVFQLWHRLWLWGLMTS